MIWDLWLIVGFAGQFVFAARFIVQWIVSEREQRSQVPVQFWYLSLVGGAITTVYAIHRRDPVFHRGAGIGTDRLCAEPDAHPSQCSTRPSAAGSCRSHVARLPPCSMAGSRSSTRDSVDEILRTPAGVFVTLKTKSNNLRGCIGSIHPVAPALPGRLR